MRKRNFWMKPLKDIVDESIDEGFSSDRVFENPSIDKLKKIAKDSPHNMARFIVRDGRVAFGADGFHKVHHDMLPPEALAAPHAHGDSYLPKYPHQRGIVDFIEPDRYEVRLKDYIHNNTVGNTSGWRLVRHPILDEFKKKGCTPMVPKKPILDLGAVNESYSLVYHKQLNNKLFDGDRLEAEVRIALLKIGKEFAKFAKIPDEAIKDIILVGGNAGYNYSKFSDLDVHIVYDKIVLNAGKYEEFIADYLIDKKALWGLTRDIKVKGYPVELYAQSSDSNLVSSGVYSLLYNKWVVFPVHDNYKMKRDGMLIKKVEDLRKTIDSMIDSQASEDEFRLMREKLKNMRSAALVAGNEFTWDNLVWKGLRNSGAMTKMNEYLRSKRDRELSLE